MQLAQSQRNLDEVSRPSFCAGRKLGEVEQALLWRLLQEDPEGPSRVLLDKVAQRQIALAVSLRQVNRLRLPWGLNRCNGRPLHVRQHPPLPSGPDLVLYLPHPAFPG